MYDLSITIADANGAEDTFSQTITLRDNVIAALFGNSEEGALYDPSDLSTLYQDAAGTTPVTSDSDPVGRMEDLSGNGNHAAQSTAAARPLYRTDGTLHWLEFDGVDDHLVVAISSASGPHLLSAGYKGASGQESEAGKYIYDAATGRLILAAPATATGTVGYFDGAWNEVPDGDVNVEAANVLVAKVYASGGGFRLNGAEEFSDSATETAIGGDQAIGRRGSASASHITGSLYGLAISAGAHQGAEVDVLEQWLADKAGVTL